MKNDREIMEKAKKIAGRRKTRVLDVLDLDHFQEICGANPKAGYIRLYSADGFVPNCYFGNAKIEAFQRTINSNGGYLFEIVSVSAKRSHGNGEIEIVKDKCPGNIVSGIRI